MTGRIAVALGLMLPIGIALAEDLFPTPQITTIDTFEFNGNPAYAMRGELGDSGIYVGLALACETHPPSQAMATAFFGSFPADRRPVQLVVQDRNKEVEKFGPRVSGGLESGFHSPQITDPHAMERFVNRALRPDSLISNGYRSFWNRVSAQRNREVRDEVLACLRRVQP